MSWKVKDLVQFDDLLKLCKAEAAENLLYPTEVTVFNSLCREFSKRFNTPLPQVLELDPEFVMRHVFEDDYSKNTDLSKYEDLEWLNERVGEMLDPDFHKKKEVEIIDFMKQAVRDDQERVKLGKPIHPAMKEHVNPLDSPKKSSEMEKPKVELPAHGGVNFDYLGKNEQ